MACFDLFNGDADGICALHQLRLAEPAECELITGIKRDVKLLSWIDAREGDRVTVLDVSLDSNREALEEVLAAGAAVRWFDHHFAGEQPVVSPRFEGHIDTDAETCTSLIVDAHLCGAHRPWAVVGAFGDNFFEAARRAAAELNLGDGQLDALQRLGELLNYNGYGVTVEDLHFHPRDLYTKVRPYTDPLAFIHEEPAFGQLAEGYAADMAAAGALRAELEEGAVALYILPDEPWARRVSGVLGNQLARAHPERAHALLTRLASGGYRVSVRSPLTTRSGADELVRQFPTGGGRKAAAGINSLPDDLYASFVDKFRAAFG